MERESLDCVVLEWADIDKYLTKAQVETLLYIIEDVETGLVDDGATKDKDYHVTLEEA